MKLSELRNFPHVETALSEACKIGVVTSQLHRFNRRTDDQKNFVRVVVHFAQKMIMEGYKKHDVFRKIVSYGRHWTGDSFLGRWKWVLRIILKKIKSWNVEYSKRRLMES